ncbi:hypothetical protein [Propionibacterium sp.]|uniref:hypothetical protein n=1 Tax=Propionibacterium sp. TaxID=1977903 RepID=UPI0039E73216
MFKNFQEDPLDAALVSGRPVLVLSPHLDDALFSASEVIRRGKNVEVWTVYAGEPDPPVTTTWDKNAGFADSRAQMAARTKEDILAYASTGVAIRRMPYLEDAYTSPGRRAADLEEFRREFRSWVQAHTSDQPVVIVPAGAGIPVNRTLLHVMFRLGWNQLSSAIKLSSSVHRVLHDLEHTAFHRWHSLAIVNGPHVHDDHTSVRDVALESLDPDERVMLVLVEELPYLWWHPADDAVAAVAARWKRTALLGGLGVDRSWKYGRIRSYSSQLPLMDPDFNRLSSPETLPEVERYWVLEESATSV